MQYSNLYDLQTQVTANADELAILNADYDVDCLDGVVNSDDTHAVLQATITKLCETVTGLADLALELSTNYVAIADINNYISAYLTSVGDSLVSSKMVPYTAVEYYGPLSNFDASGAGIGNWVDVYLCNGLNGTPDKRGRVGVGAIVGMGGGALDSQVDPATATNPNYSLLTKSGTNTITLTSAQIPSHTHTGTTNTTGSIHAHTLTETVPTVTNNGIPYIGDAFTDIDNINAYSVTYTDPGGEHTHTFTTNATGGGDAHLNIQPSIACYYIIYLP